MFCLWRAHLQKWNGLSSEVVIILSEVEQAFVIASLQDGLLWPHPPSPVFTTLCSPVPNFSNYVWPIEYDRNVSLSLSRLDYKRHRIIYFGHSLVLLYLSLWVKPPAIFWVAQWRDLPLEELMPPANSHMSEFRSGSSCPSLAFRWLHPQLTA